MTSESDESKGDAFKSRVDDIRSRIKGALDAISRAESRDEDDIKRYLYAAIWELRDSFKPDQYLFDANAPDLVEAAIRRLQGVASGTPSVSGGAEPSRSDPVIRDGSERDSG